MCSAVRTFGKFIGPFLSFSRIAHTVCVCRSENVGLAPLGYAARPVVKRSLRRDRISSGTFQDRGRLLFPSSSSSLPLVSISRNFLLSGLRKTSGGRPHAREIISHFPGKMHRSSSPPPPSSRPRALKTRSPTCEFSLFLFCFPLCVVIMRM